MRLAFLGSRLKKLCPEDVAGLFDVFYGKPRPASAKKMHAILVSPDGLREVFGNEKYKEIHAAAIELGLRRVSRLLPTFRLTRKAFPDMIRKKNTRWRCSLWGTGGRCRKRTLKTRLTGFSLTRPDGHNQHSQ